jgi:hypothetical protein
MQHKCRANAAQSPRNRHAIATQSLRDRSAIAVQSPRNRRAIHARSQCNRSAIATEPLPNPAQLLRAIAHDKDKARVSKAHVFCDKPACRIMHNATRIIFSALSAVVIRSSLVLVDGSDRCIRDVAPPSSISVIDRSRRSIALAFRALEWKVLVALEISVRFRGKQTMRCHAGAMLYERVRSYVR